MKKGLIIAGIGILALSGCTDFHHENQLLFFGQTDTFGIELDGSAPNQGVTFSFGYRGHNFAIIPVLANDYPELADGQSLDKDQEPDAEVSSWAQRPCSEEQSKKNPNMCGKDTYSVFGQFEAASRVNSDGTEQKVEASLGKFFATGFAAQELASGFKKKLENEHLSMKEEDEENESN